MVAVEAETVTAVVVVSEVGSETVESSVDIVVVIVAEMTVAAVVAVEVEIFAVSYIACFLVAAVIALLGHHLYAYDSMLDNLRSNDSHDIRGMES